MLGGFVLGAVVGAVVGTLVLYGVLDPQGLREKLLGFRDSVTTRAPSGEQASARGKAFLAFASRYWKIGLVVLVVVILIISSVIQQASQLPQLHLGLNTLKDACGVSTNVNITVEDVRRGQIVIGTTSSCRRVITLRAGQ